ncbi:MAG: PAS domain-containing protein [Oscillospiraceae bacterium]|nr:PAS domain-containing protein [Oscillospiraceae bacterium]
MERQEIIQSSIVRDLAEGVMVIGSDGVIEAINKAALQIVERKREDLVGKNFALAFFTEDENDAFVQTVLDAVYERGRQQESYLPFRIGETVKQLRIVSSYLRDGKEIIGVILVISDITELVELRDAIQAMKTIQNLNRQLELRNRVLQETFGRYLSDEIVSEILDSPEGWKLGGQKRTLTVMMSDLRGFTAMSERMQPQDLITMLNHYFSQMYEEIEKYHGTLIEFEGDGMLVIFGAPSPSETHASDAVAAAIGMQKRMKLVNRWNREHGFEPIAMGIGLNTDAMILGNIGSEKRTKYGVLGAAVNLTGRIESYTTGGQILISPGTRDAIREKLQIVRTLQVMPKGVEKEITISQVTGIGEPYDVYLEAEDAPELEKITPFPITFTVLEGKHAEKEEKKGRLTAVSEREAILETAENLDEFDNLLLKVEDGLYAKVTEVRQGGFRICFTSRPSRFQAWLQQLRQASDIGTEGEKRS